MLPIKCRIYLFTYDRNNLLERAVNSLLAQTFTNWICEVHNDLPGNNFPGNYIQSLNDERFTVINHPVNLGPTASFNLAFNGCDEKYVSILEDDNWWEPGFLQEMIYIMETHNTIDVSWSNMRIWKENEDHTWLDTQKTIWPSGNNILFDWPHPKQALGALYSNGAMIYKGVMAKKYQIPQNVLFNAMEMVRERCFEHPIYLVSKPLANFSFTIKSSQSNNGIKWTGAQIMMLASYIGNSENKKNEFINLLKYNQNSKPSTIPVFFLSVIFYTKDYRLLYYFNISDWLKIIRWCLRNVFNVFLLKSYLKSQYQTWCFLKECTPVIPSNDTI